MSSAPNPHPQSSKSASSPQSRTKDQANSAPEPSSPAEPMTDQPNSLLATPPTRKPKDAAPKSAAPNATASTDQAAPTDQDQSEQPLAEAKPVAAVDGDATTTTDIEAIDDAEDAPVAPSEPSITDSTSEQLSQEVEEFANTTPPTASSPESSEPVAQLLAGETAPTEATLEPLSPPPPPRHQPIPPASEPMQYRAIGLVRGKYMPSEEQFTRGFILTEDEVLIDSVLLGRVMSLVKKHIDLEQSHLWVVYPRTRERDLELHMQIVGVWEPEKLNRTASLDESDETIDETATDEAAMEESAAESEDEIFTSEASDGSAVDEDLNDRYFSVRGEVVYQAQEEQRLLVKIRRAPKPSETEGKAFKVALKGTLEGKVLGYFWDLQVQRENNELIVTEATQIGMVPPQKRGADGGGRGRPPRRGAGGPPRRGGPGAGVPPRKRWAGGHEDERPMRSDRGDRPERSERPSTPSVPRQPISKPVKRRPKDEES